MGGVLRHANLWTDVYGRIDSADQRLVEVMNKIENNCIELSEFDEAISPHQLIPAGDGKSLQLLKLIIDDVLNNKPQKLNTILITGSQGKRTYARALCRGIALTDVREIDARVLHHNGDVQQLFYKPSTETGFIITESNFINTTVQKLIWQILITEKYSIYSYDMSRIEHYSVTGVLIFTALSRSVTPRIVLENVDWIIEIGDYSPQQRLLCVLQRLKYCQMNYECEEALSRIVEVGGIKLREIIRFLRICIAFARREGQVVRKEDVEKAAKIWM